MSCCHSFADTCWLGSCGCRKCLLSGLGRISCWKVAPIPFSSNLIQPGHSRWIGAVGCASIFGWMINRLQRSKVAAGSSPDSSALSAAGWGDSFCHLQHFAVTKLARWCSDLERSLAWWQKRWRCPWWCCLESAPLGCRHCLLHRWAQLQTVLVASLGIHQMYLWCSHS